MKKFIFTLVFSLAILTHISPSFADTDGDGIDSPTDCNDNDDTIYPGADETSCNGIDNDCDSLIDEDSTFTTYYQDSDGDTYGNPDVSESICSAPTSDYVLDNTDFDDTDATLYPDAPELCDGKDNDNDGETDNGIATTTYYVDSDGDGFTNDLTTYTVCTVDSADDYCAIESYDFLCGGNSSFDPTLHPETPSTEADCKDSDASIYPTAPEICDDSTDNDCDGKIDCDDSDCASEADCAVVEDCNNDIDDDGDDKVDCDDSDCSTETACEITPAPSSGGSSCKLIQTTSYNSAGFLLGFFTIMSLAAYKKRI